MPACAVTLSLAYLGNDPMRVTILLGVIGAYELVKKRRVYPFGRLLSSACETLRDESEMEAVSLRIERHKESLRNIALVWFGFLLIVCGLALLGPTVDIHYFSGPDLLNPLTRISAIVVIVFSHMTHPQRAVATQYFGLALFSLDYLILLSFSAFFSMTGSSCLYWLFLYHKDSASLAERA